MAAPIDFTNQLSRTTVLSADTPVATAQQAVAEQQAAFLVIDSLETQAFISVEQLANISAYQGATLHDLSEQLPPLVTLDSTWSSLSTDQVETLGQALEVTSAPGVLVYRGREVLGVLSAKTLMESVPTEVTRVSRGLDGTSTVPFRVYSCQTCGSLRIPSTGDSTSPICPKDSSHGPMLLESS